MWMFWGNPQVFGLMPMGGTAGDNSDSGQGNFFEGVMTARYSSNAADDAVQANIVAAYGP
jgi:hypothetical protein